MNDRILSTHPTNRLHVVDALRGFAIVSILLLHNIEHFDFYFSPTNLPLWVQSIDKVIWEVMFFLFGGKSYAIFALLFGLTFFIQSDNQAKKGKDFRGRFAWRLFLLLGFGMINSAFFEGDILSIYAVLGFCLIPVTKLSNKAVFWIALVLMLQPYEWYRVIEGMLNPDKVLSNPASWAYFDKAAAYITGDSLIDTWAGNLTNGKLAVIYWTWEMGRVFQNMALFMFGMLAGRLRVFEPTPAAHHFWRKALIMAASAFCVLYPVKLFIGGWIDSQAILRPLQTIETSLTNMAFMVVLVSGFTLLFQTVKGNRLLKGFSPMGRMSLSNYILQSIVGSFIYYGFGLGLYQYTGATYAILIGVVLAFLQSRFSTWWMKNHKQGPLEILWHKGTWINSRNALR